jgi:hypothetical protein
VREQISIARGGSFTRLSPTELKVMLKRWGFMLVNTPVPFTGDIPGADLSIPYDQVGLEGAGFSLEVHVTISSASTRATGISSTPPATKKVVEKPMKWIGNYYGAKRLRLN